MSQIYVRGDRIAAGLLLVHTAIAFALAPVFGTWMAAGVVSVSALSLFALSMWRLPGGAFTRSLAGLVLQLFVALHIYQMHGLPEMHFFFFTGCTALLVYQDGNCLWAGAIGIILQHLIFARLHNAGVQVFSFEEGHVSSAKVAIHFAIALGHVICCGYWAELMRRQTLATTDQNDRLADANKELMGEMGERMQAEVALRLSKEEAERANHAKSDFLSRMSHELRTPLNAILGFSQLLELEPLSDDQRQSVRHVLKGGKHLLNLINEVLDLARIEAGRLDFSLEPVALASLLEETMTLVYPLARPRKIELRFDNQDEGRPGVHVKADLQRLKQVLLNLLSNAIKYNRDGGTVEARWTMLPESPDARAGGQWLRLSLRDSGHGIDHAMLPRLFTPFDRLGAENGEIEGSGIGLALSKRLLEAMGGTIDVESVPGKGSTFSINLPVIAAPPQEVRDFPLLLSAAAAAHFPERTVLQIEDNQANRQVIERVLEMRPRVKLLSAIQGGIGLELARQHLPDLVLLDLNLPDLSGMDVLSRLQSDPLTAHLPVVVLSADATPHQIQRVLKLGARHYLTKPFHLSKLIEILDELLESPEPSAPLPKAA